MAVQPWIARAQLEQSAQAADLDVVAMCPETQHRGLGGKVWFEVQHAPSSTAVAVRPGCEGTHPTAAAVAASPRGGSATTVEARYRTRGDREFMTAHSMSTELPRHHAARLILLCQVAIKGASRC